MRCFVKNFFYHVFYFAFLYYSGKKTTTSSSEQAKEAMFDGFYSTIACKPSYLVGGGMGESLSGLSQKQVKARLKRFGYNDFKEHKSPLNGFFENLIHACINPINILLLIVALVSFLTGDRIGFFIILAMIFFSIVLTVFQEHRSTIASIRLENMVVTKATVLRKKTVDSNGCEAKSSDESLLARRQVIPMRDIVPGDTIFLSAGDLISADIRLTSAKDLFVNQSALTGESSPVEKFFHQVPLQKDNDSTQQSIFDLYNICFSGSSVVSGTGIGIVLKTGKSTYFGSLAKKITSKKPSTSFEKDVRSFTWLLIRFMFLMVPVVFLLNGWLKNQWIEAFLFSTAVAIGLTPEMLPMILTVNLSKGALSMARKKVVVKRLHAIQNFGAMDILCTDKTGTLTQDRVMLERCIDVGGNKSEKVLHYAFLNSFYQTCLRSLIDTALLTYGVQETNIGQFSTNNVQIHYTKVDEVPFDFSRRCMSVVLNEISKNQNVLVCKGAPEEVLALCNSVEKKNGNCVNLCDFLLKKYKSMVQSFNEDGLRVIAVAYKNFPSTKEQYTVRDEKDMTLVGFVSFFDPPKENAKEVVDLLYKKGIKTIILTGDNSIVAQNIARHVSMSTQVLSGAQIDCLSDNALCQKLATVSVFAKLNPLQKERIVRLLKEDGHVVGFMGDGINDALALRMADVGISVDNAVDAAKEAADIILLEKNLLVLGEGVSEGRIVFSNILKYIRLSASGNFGNVFTLIGASLFLPFLPILPVQLLLQNLLYDFSQMTVPLDTVDSCYICKPGRWSINDIKKFMLTMGPVSSVFDYITFFFMWFILGENTIAHQAIFQTGWFVESLLSQILVFHVIRTGKIPFIRSVASKPVLFSSACVAIICLVLPFTKIGNLFGFVQLSSLYFSGLFFILLLYCAVAFFVRNKFLLEEV